MRQPNHASYKDAAWIIAGLMIFAVSCLGWIPAIRTPATLEAISSFFLLVVAAGLALAFFQKKEVRT